jgi:hypothetical protein
MIRDFLALGILVPHNVANPMDLARRHGDRTSMSPRAAFFWCLKPPKLLAPKRKGKRFSIFLLIPGKLKATFKFRSLQKRKDRS